MATIGALALATKGPFEGLLDRPPYSERAALLSQLMLRNIITHAVFQCALCFVVLFGAEKFFKLDTSFPRVKTSFLFNKFVFCQVFDLLNARITEFGQRFFEGFLTNPFFGSLFAFVVATQVMHIEFGGEVFGCEHLPWHQWLWSIATGALELAVGAVLRVIPIGDDTVKRLIVNREERERLCGDDTQG